MYTYTFALELPIDEIPNIMVFLLIFKIAHTTEGIKIYYLYFLDFVERFSDN